MILKLCVVCSLWLVAVSGVNSTITATAGATTAAPSTTSRGHKNESTIWSNISAGFARVFAKRNLVPLLCFVTVIIAAALLLGACVQYRLSRCRASRARSSELELQPLNAGGTWNPTAEKDDEVRDRSPSGANGRASPVAEPGADISAAGGAGIYEVVDDDGRRPSEAAEPLSAESPAAVPAAAVAAANDSLTMVDNELYRSVGPGNQGCEPGAHEGDGTGPAHAD